MNAQKQLDNEELDVMKHLESTSYRSVDNLSESKATAREAAKNSLKKSRSITLRLTEKDYLKIKAVAAEEGMPYQTLVGSILHKYVYR